MLLLVLFAKTSFKPKRFTGAIMFLGAHFAWFLVAAIFTGAWSAVLPDPLLLGFGLAWLWLRPGLAPALVLGLYTLFGVAISVTQLFVSEVGSAEPRAHVIHLILRLAALAALVTGHRLPRKVQTPSPLVSSDGA